MFSDTTGCEIFASLCWSASALLSEMFSGKPWIALYVLSVPSRKYELMISNVDIAQRTVIRSELISLPLFCTILKILVNKNLIQVKWHFFNNPERGLQQYFEHSQSTVFKYYEKTSDHMLSNWNFEEIHVLWRTPFHHDDRNWTKLNLKVSIFTILLRYTLSFCICEYDEFKMYQIFLPNHVSISKFVPVAKKISWLDLLALRSYVSLEGIITLLVCITHI